MKNNILIFLCLMFISDCIAQPDLSCERLLTPKQMKEDVLYLFSTIEKTHPCPYYVLGEKEYERSKNDLLTNINQPMALWEFSLVVNSVNSWFDVHTQVELCPEVDKLLRKNNSWPMFFYSISAKENTFFFSTRFGTPDSLKGKEIMTINEVNCLDIYAKLSRYCSNESSNFVDLKLSSSAFAYLYPLLYGMPSKLEIRYKRGNDIECINLSHEDFLKWAIIEEKNDRKVDKRNLNFTFYPEAKIAIFELNTFDCFDFDNDDCESGMKIFKDKIDGAYDSLTQNGYTHLFVDIRNNGGGISQMSTYILNHISDVPDKFLTATICEKVKSSKELKCTDYYFIKEVSTTYRGDIYILQSHKTYSAAVELSCNLKSLKLGCILGTETGGLTSCYIDSYEYTLPNSKLYFSCSYKKCRLADSQFDGRGVLPDIEYPMNNLDRSFTLDELKQFIEMCESK